MLKDITITELAKRAGISSESLLRAIKAETEETIAFETDGEFISHVDLDLIKERAGKDSYKDGKTAGEEMKVKAAKEKYNLEFEGKTIDALIEAAKEKFSKESGVEPNKKIQELESDNQKLRANLTEAETKLKAESENFKKSLANIEIETFVKNNIPEKLPNGLTRDQAYKLYRFDREFNKSETGIELIDPANKQVVKDKHLKPVSVTDDIRSFLEQFGSIPEQGRGGKDEIQKQKTNIDALMSRSQVEDYIEKMNIPLPQQAGILTQAMKNEGFDLTK